MLHHLFKPSVSRAEHNALKGERATLQGLLATVKLERDKAIAERNELKEAVIASGVHAGEIIAIAERALTLLNEVDPSRTGGKQLREAREALFADARLSGLWGELPGKED